MSLPSYYLTLLAKISCFEFLNLSACQGYLFSVFFVFGATDSCSRLTSSLCVFIAQELINRHLITMAQIDQSENPGIFNISSRGLIVGEKDAAIAVGWCVHRSL